MKRKVGLKFLSLIGLLLSSCSLLDIFGIKVEMVNIEGESNEIFVDDTLELTANVFPSNAKNKQVTWRVTNEAVASVTQEGVVKGLKEGNTVVEAISKQNSSIKGTFDLSVVEPILSSISIKTRPATIRYYEGDYFDPTGLVLKANYNNGSTKNIAYSNSTKSDFSFSPSLSAALTLDNDLVTITYKGKITTQSIVVREEGTIDKVPVDYTYDDYTANNVYQIDNCPLVGNPKLLIIPIWFNDSDSFISTTKKNSVREDIQKAYTGTTTDTGWHSVKTYYETESNHKITLSATIADWYNINESYLTYAPKSAIYNTANLVEKASNAYFTNHSSDSRKNYDSNGDGYLDGVMLIYAAPDCQNSGYESYENLWAYCYWLQNYSNKNNPTANAFFWASYDFMYGSNATSRTGHNFSRGYTEYGVKIDTHCLIHEMGHVFGLEDYYDYSYNELVPAGGFSMQDSNVGGHDPYSVMAYGWADPYIPDRSITISLGDFQSTHEVILLANHSMFNPDDNYKFSPFDEYLLIEYYTPTGLNEFDSKHTYRDNYPDGSSIPGIRLWHVDARLTENGQFSESSITTIPSGSVTHLMSNSYGGDNASPYGVNYNILQLIRKDTSATYRPNDNFNDGNIFKAGDSFNMSTYSSQFVKGNKMNDGKALGWSFTVNSLNEAGATITLTKA